VRDRQRSCSLERAATPLGFDPRACEESGQTVIFATLWAHAETSKFKLLPSSGDGSTARLAAKRSVSPSSSHWSRQEMFSNITENITTKLQLNS
jgi:hypothetical protein